jgi:hypothetical protein
MLPIRFAWQASVVDADSKFGREIATVSLMRISMGLANAGLSEDGSISIQDAE